MSDVYVALHISTTADDNGVYVARDSSEIIELLWCLIDAITLDEIHKDSVLVKPINTPITPLCTSMTTLTWENVRNAGTLKDAILKLDFCLQEMVIKKNLEFSFITLNSWDLRMKLPKESRERSIMLPPYLELSRYFDLKKEFIKWQEFIHPDYLTNSNITINQILLQLGVDLSNFQMSTNLTIPFHLNSPKRASDEVQLLSCILKSLLQKLPQNLSILKQPYDSHLDLKQFFQEKSKILYMSNLPIDTTQSELESWFTQFGGRPIAFWTLKNCQDNHNGNNNNNNNNKPTANGFAIFATHDEAVDSLSMNGRLLNDKIIEVQPSSIRVLDRSQEILTPFPSSKNRPRPGDWTCPLCGFSNFQRRTACFRCSFPLASAAAIQESMYPGKSTNNYNHHDHNEHNTQQQQHHFNQNNHHQQQHHQNMNHQLPQQNRNNSSVPFRAGDWKCDFCFYHNFAKNICCLKCGSPRSNNNINGNRHITHQNTLSNTNLNQPQQFYNSIQQFSQLPTPTSSTTNSTSQLATQFLPQQSELMLNQINSLNLNNNLYRTSTGSTTDNNSNSNLVQQQQQFISNDLFKKNDDL